MKSNKPDYSSRFFNIYPNPAKEKITIGFNSQIDNLNAIIIRDNLGRIVYENNKPALVNEQIIDLSALAKGLYFISVESNKKTFTKKIILQ